MKHSINHDLELGLAKRATEAALKSYSERFAEYSPKCSWRGDSVAEISFTVKGVSLRGTLEVKPRSIEMDLDVPFLLRPFKGKALGVIEEKIKEWIAKAKAGQIT